MMPLVADLLAKRTSSQSPLPSPTRHAHLVGIAGSGMTTLSRVLSESGWRITGSDPSAPANTPGVHLRHDPAHLNPSPDLVIHSSAIGDDNCEVAAANASGLDVASYPEMLGRLTRSRMTLAIAGTHGKSSTGAMLAEILVVAGIDPLVLVGATNRQGAPIGRAGQGAMAVVEACEYRQAFLQLTPSVAALLSVEPDHFDCFPTSPALLQAFKSFCAQIDPAGSLVVNAESPGAVAAASSARCRKIMLGGKRPDWHVDSIVANSSRVRFQLAGPSMPAMPISLRVIGRHNVFNATAAAAIASSVGISNEAIRLGLESYDGLARRLEPAGRFGPALWYDDYAHHPSEVAAGLTALRAAHPDRRIWCVFQPHQRSRFVRLMGEFAVALHAADRVMLADVFHAREIASNDARTLVERLATSIRSGGTPVAACGSVDELALVANDLAARGELTSDDLVVTMGAGDIRRLGPSIRSQAALAAA